MGVAADDELLDLPGVPPGLVARRVRQYRATDDGQRVERTHRRGLRKVTRVELVAPASARQLELADNEERWVLDARHRRWATIEKRYGEAAMQRAVELVHGGAVRLLCPVDDNMRVGAPTGWALSEEWQCRADDALRQRERERGDLALQAAVAADAVEHLCAPLASALRNAAPANPTTAVLARAAEDLAAGVFHDGPRAFSQTHFASTKARDDVAEVLRRAGVGDDVLAALGVRRSSRLGVAGPVTAVVAGRNIDLGLFDGPVLLRADQQDLRLRLTTTAPLVVVENLQAAEVLADQRADVPIVYTAGPPSDAALGLIAQLGAYAAPELVVPDADLGGVRIAERVLTALPAARIIDIGEFDHPVGEAWPADGVSIAGLRIAETGPAGGLARACLNRGYPVEQELASVRAVREALEGPHVTPAG